MTSTLKRRLSILLCVAMVLAMMPMAVSAASTTTLYCAAPANWSKCNVYWWGSSQSNPGWPGEAMTKGADGIWYYAVPADAGNVIFNNGSGAQSADLVMPTDDKVQFNYSAKEWVTYGSAVEEVETVYYLRGSMNNWGLDNPMTKNTDGTYSVTMDLAAGIYEYKAAIEDWSWSVPGGANLSLNLEADDTVTFVLDLGANSLTYTLASGTVVEVEYFLRGSMNDWSANDASKMVKQADGTYAITLSLAAGTYEYKAAVADWSWSVPGGENATLTLAEAADVTFVLDVAAGTLTDNAPAAEDPSEPSEDPSEPSEGESYVVAGSTDLCGNGNTGYGWDPTDMNNLMTDNGDGTYSKVYKNVVVMEKYQLKVVEVCADGTMVWYGVNGSDNATFNVTAVCDVTVTFDTATQEITVTGDGVELDSGLEIESVRVVGDGDGVWLNGVLWDPANDLNLMTEIAPGVWQITYKNVEKFDNYQLKFAANGSWAINWGGVYEGSGVVSVAEFNSTNNITIDVPYELADVTLTLDLRAFDASTNTGAIFKIEIEDVSEPTDPSDPSEEPTDPSYPELETTWPEDYTTWPTEPEEPSEPELPVDPSEATDPSEEPSESEEPTDPSEEPTEPEEPSESEEPTEPEEPSEPVKVEKVGGLNVLSVGTHYFEIEWNALEGATKYWVYVDGKVYASTTGTTMTVSKRESGVEYAVNVTALLEDGTILSLDKAETLFVETECPVLGSSYDSGINSITITFDAQETSKVWIYFGTSEDNLKLYCSTTEQFYTIFNLQADTQYYYKLAYYIDGQIVEDVDVTAVCTYADESLNVTATEVEGSLQLDWEANGDSWKYWVIVETAEKTYIYSTTETEYALSGFDFAACSVSVRGVNSDGMYDYNPVIL